VGSFYFFQVIGSLFSLAILPLGICTASAAVFASATSLLFLNGFGISILGTNLLCHRYLLEKAKAMSTM
jgi:hypothetical protein